MFTKITKYLLACWPCVHLSDLSLGGIIFRFSVFDGTCAWKRVQRCAQRYVRRCVPKFSEMYLEICPEMCPEMCRDVITFCAMSKSFRNVFLDVWVDLAVLGVVRSWMFPCSNILSIQSYTYNLKTGAQICRIWDVRGGQRCPQGFKYNWVRLLVAVTPLFVGVPVFPLLLGTSARALQSLASRLCTMTPMRWTNDKRTECPPHLGL